MIKRFIFMLLFVLCGSASASTMIIGDSHVGGMKPYLQKSMSVRYRNGTTSSYWLRQPTAKVNTLIIHTGTNDIVGGVSASTWMAQNRAICNKWKPNRCLIVKPPVNRRKNISSYRAVGGNIPTVLNGSGLGKDGIHYNMSMYKKQANIIKGYAR